VRCQILLVSGSLRSASTTAAVLRTAREVAPPGVHAAIYDGLDRLPHFNPDLDTDPLPAEVARLRAAIHDGDAIVFSTPEYAGALPGSFKNLLDWTIGDDHPGSIYTKPVGWLNASPRNADGAHHELRTVLGYAHATIVDDACAHVPVSGVVIGPDGLIDDPGTRDAISRALAHLAQHLGCTAGAWAQG
jgi:chromate reductase